MNKRRIIALADRLAKKDKAPLFDKQPLGFNMAVWFHTAAVPYHPEICYTAACLAGWVITLWGTPYQKYDLQAGKWNIRANAQVLLGLDTQQAAELFTPIPGIGTNRHRADITAKEAASTLRRLAKTGRVKWRV